MCRLNIEDLHQNFYDKLVRIKHKNYFYVGRVYYIGVNPLHNTLQVTLDRTPLWPVDPINIELYERSTKIFN